MQETDSVFLAGAGEIYIADPEWIDGFGTQSGYEDTIAMIKAPEGKELMIGVSGADDLLTLTVDKGKNGEGLSASYAMAGVIMYVAYMPTDEVVENVCTEGEMGAPEMVPLSMRHQVLAVDVDLDHVDARTCDAIDSYGTLQEDECLASLLDIEGSIWVARGRGTAAACYFNFVATDLPRSTTYQVAACFTGNAVAEVLSGKGGALSYAGIGSRMVTAREVRTIRNTFEVEDEQDPFLGLLGTKKLPAPTRAAVFLIARLRAIDL